MTNENPTALAGKTPTIRRMAGHLYGTNTGKLFLEFAVVDGAEAISGKLRINDDLVGLLILHVTGSFDGTHLNLSATEVREQQSKSEGSPESLPAPLINFEANLRLNPAGSFGGRWETNLGNAGTAQLFPHDHLDGQQGTDKADPVPSRLHQSSRQLGVIRLALGDIRRIIELLQTELPQNEVIVAYGPSEKAVIVTAPEFIRSASNIGDISQLRLDARSMGPDGLTRSATVELGRFDKNEISAAGGSDVWVSGAVNALSDQLTSKQARVANLFLKHWGDINALVLFALIIWLPGVPSFVDRLYIALVALVGMVALAQASKRLIPIAIIRLSTENRGTFDKIIPGLLTGLLTTAVAAIAATFLSAFDASGLLGQLLEWFQSVLPDELAPETTTTGTAPQVSAPRTP